MPVEAAFSQLPITDTPGNISWYHLFLDFFCLSYKDQRLINEAEYLIKFGIKDCDQSLRHETDTWLDVLDQSWFSTKQEAKKMNAREVQEDKY